MPGDVLGPEVREEIRVGIGRDDSLPGRGRARTFRTLISRAHLDERRTVDLCAQDSGRSMAPAARMERSATLAESMHSLDRAADRVALSAIGGTWHRVRIGGSDDTGFRLSFVGK
jgi:hypothetical protein